MTTECSKVAVVIPSFKVKSHIIGVIEKIGTEVSRIYVVDDCCPEGTGAFVKAKCLDSRVVVIFHDKNQGVGGAVITGYKAAIEEGMDIIVKIDGDGQMDPELIENFIEPITSGMADYTKGNRFFDLEEIRSMPKIRIFGNAVLSLITKLSSGYWDLFDPTNGYTAIHCDVARHLPFSKISSRYFFETDMLFRLNSMRALVLDIPMAASYKNEVSNLIISDIASEFLLKNIRNGFKRIFYNYYLRDMSLASIELPFGLVMFLFGIFFGMHHWRLSFVEGVTTPAGTVMLAVLPIILGFQLILGFIGYDIANQPRIPIHKFRKISSRKRKKIDENDT